MDSSSELPTDGDLDRVMAQALNAFYTGRSSLAATFFSRAEALAARLHNDALSLVPAWLRRWRAVSLGLQSCAVSEAAGMTRGEAPRAQIMSLHEEEAELQRGVVAVVERRASAGTTVRRKRAALSRLQGCEDRVVFSHGSSRSPSLHPGTEIWNVPRR